MSDLMVRLDIRNLGVRTVAQSGSGTSGETKGQMPKK